MLLFTNFSESFQGFKIEALRVVCGKGDVLFIDGAKRSITQAKTYACKSLALFSFGLEG